jgi:Superinfection immunity protein
MEVFALILLILAAIFYFIPTDIAKQLEAKNFGSIFFINLVFGWTVLWLDRLRCSGRSGRRRKNPAPCRHCPINQLRDCQSEDLLAPIWERMNRRKQKRVKPFLPSLFLMLCVAAESYCLATNRFSFVAKKITDVRVFKR